MDETVNYRQDLGVTLTSKWRRLSDDFQRFFVQIFLSIGFWLMSEIKLLETYP